MRTDQLGMQWLEPLLLQATEEYRAQQVQIETMLAEGVVLSLLFFNQTEGQREAALFQRCLVDDPEIESSTALSRRPCDDLEG